MVMIAMKKVKEEKYVSKNGSFSLDYSKECRTDSSRYVVLMVQPWRELGFSALDDDLPLTTLLTCVSTGQSRQADRPDRPQILSMID